MEVDRLLKEADSEVEMLPLIEMINHPRENPYIFYDEYLEDDGT